MALEFTPFVRRPFMVEAVEVTTENIREIAEMVGSLKFDENTGAPYIVVNRKKVPNVYRVTPGYLVTRVDGKIRAYSHNSFRAQFISSTPDIEEWVAFMNEGTQPDQPEQEDDNEEAKESVG